MARAAKNPGGRTKKVVSEKVTTEVRKNTAAWSVTNVIAIILTLVIIAFVGYALDLSKNNGSTKDAKQSVASVQSVRYDGEDGKNALDLLKSKAEIKTQESSIGIFVISINGVENSDRQYWMFYVNDELSSVAADQYTTKSADKIEWRYETFE